MESEGLAESLGIKTVPLEVGDKKYTLSAPTITQLYFDLRDYLASLRPNVLTEAAKAIVEIQVLPVSPSEQMAMIAEVRSTASAALGRAAIVDDEEIAQFERSVEGLCFRLWKSLQEHHASEFPTLQSAVELTDRYAQKGGDLGLLNLLLESVTGEADAKNASGPSPSARENEPPQISPDGRPSSDSSVLSIPDTPSSE